MIRPLFSVVRLLASTVMATAASLPVTDHARAEAGDQKAVLHGAVDSAALKPLFAPVKAVTSARDAATVMPDMRSVIPKKQTTR